MSYDVMQKHKSMVEKAEKNYAEIIEKVKNYRLFLGDYLVDLLLSTVDPVGLISNFNAKIQFRRIIKYCDSLENELSKLSDNMASLMDLSKTDEELEEFIFDTSKRVQQTQHDIIIENMAKIIVMVITNRKNIGLSYPLNEAENLLNLLEDFSEDEAIVFGALCQMYDENAGALCPLLKQNLVNTIVENHGVPNSSTRAYYNDLCSYLVYRLDAKGLIEPIESGPKLSGALKDSLGDFKISFIGKKLLDIISNKYIKK